MRNAGRSTGWPSFSGTNRRIAKLLHPHPANLRPGLFPFLDDLLRQRLGRFRLGGRFDGETRDGVDRQQQERGQPSHRLNPLCALELHDAPRKRDGAWMRSLSSLRAETQTEISPPALQNPSVLTYPLTSSRRNGFVEVALSREGRRGATYSLVRTRVRDTRPRGSASAVGSVAPTKLQRNVGPPIERYELQQN